MAMRNAGDVPTSVLTAVILPAGSQRSPSFSWTESTPAPGAPEGVAVRVLGSGIVTQGPDRPFEVSTERLVLGPGVSIPAQPGPTFLLSVELGRHIFALVGGGVLGIARAIPSPKFNATPGTTYALGVGDAVFFSGGMIAVPRSKQDGTLVVFRRSILRARADPRGRAGHGDRT